MMLIFFFNGLAFGGLGLAAYLQLHQESDLPLGKHLKWLAAFGFACALTNWIDMFLESGGTESYLLPVLQILRMIAQPITGLLLLKYGWGILKEIPLPPWTIFLPGVLIVPLAYVITYATTTFITPSPLAIPIDIWSRYLLYLPGSILAGIGFIRQWHSQRKNGVHDVAKLMLGAGGAFLFEAFIVGLVVPATPYGPGTYYNYNRVIHNAFSAEAASLATFSGFSSWLDYQYILEITGLPIQFWRMLSSFAVTFFIVRSLDVFKARRKMQLSSLQRERDRAREAAFEVQVSARQAAEKWTEVLFSINRKIIELDGLDAILLFITSHARPLLGADFVGLALLDEERANLELKCYSLEAETELVGAKVAVRSAWILDTMLRGVSERVSSDGQPGPLEHIIYFDEMPAHEAAIVCLEFEGKPVGAFWAARSARTPFTDTDMIWLECMAGQVVITIQHSIMTSQLQSLSITEERSRMAREMHDGLAQILGYLNLQVQTLDALLKQGKQNEVALELEQMRKAVKTANADVRENILSLRTTLANENGLVSAIGEYLDEFGIQTGIATQFTDEVQSDLNISSIAEVQLVCILQEALANVRKHAHAGRVSVTITRKRWQESDAVRVEITDNGMGISNNDSKYHYGLKTMEERACSVGGSLDIISAAGRGTTIACTLPQLKQGKIKKDQAYVSKSGSLSLLETSRPK